MFIPLPLESLPKIFEISIAYETVTNLFGSLCATFCGQGGASRWRTKTKTKSAQPAAFPRRASIHKCRRALKNLIELIIID
jgi:hypothetical protein